MILFAVMPGCGRIDFDPLHADAASGLDATPRCSPQAPFTNIRRFDSLDSATVDGGGRLNSDETIAYFHSARGGNYELWTATRTSRDLPFETPTVVLTSGPFWPTVTSNGLTIVYSGNTDLETSTRGSVGEVFPPGALMPAIDSASAQTTPFFGPLGTKLYFAMTQGTQKIYAAPWPPSGPGQLVADQFDAGAVQSAPVLSADELVMYFMSDVTGGGDVFVEQRQSVDASFGPATPVGEVNSPAPDAPTSVSSDLCRLYFETGRSGDYDIWIAERTP